MASQCKIEKVMPIASTTTRDPDQGIHRKEDETMIPPGTPAATSSDVKQTERSHTQPLIPLGLKVRKEWFRQFPKHPKCPKPELVGCVHLCALHSPGMYHTFREKALLAQQEEGVSHPSKSPSVDALNQEEEEKKKLLPIKNQCKVVFIDGGRYQTGGARAFRSSGWVRLIPCPRHVRSFPQPPLELLSRAAGFIWLKNRGRFPVRLFSKHQCLVNHLPDEWELTKKDRLAANLARYGSLLRKKALASTSTLEDEYAEKASTEEKEDEISSSSDQATTASMETDAEATLPEESFTSSPKEKLRHEHEPLPIPIHPETYNLRNWSECIQFCEPLIAERNKRRKVVASPSATLEEDQATPPSCPSAGEESGLDVLWILKPSKGSGGNGIRLLQSDDLNALLDDYARLREEYGDSIPPVRRGADRNPSLYCLTCKIVQRYITKPMLVNGRKFDIRAYFFVASAEHDLVFYHDGYIRVNAVEYDSDLKDLSNKYAHLSNITIQKKHPNFSDICNTMRWELPEFQRYLTENKLAAPDYVDRVLRPQMKAQLWYAFQSARPRLCKSSHYFLFAGADFLLDASGRVWLLEFSKSPACYRSPGAPHLTNNWNRLICETAAIAQEVCYRNSVGQLPPPEKAHTLHSLRNYHVALPLSHCKEYRKKEEIEENTRFESLHIS